MPPCALHRPLDVALRDDTPIRIRAVQPKDRALIQEGLERFSRTSTYHRFFTPVVQFTEEHLRYLTEVDGRDHCALGALDRSADIPIGVGIARYIRLPEEPKVAEAAVSVLDAYQGKGAGSLLLAALSQCAQVHDVETFRGYLLDANRRFIDHLLRLGAVQKESHSGIVRVEVPVQARHDDGAAEGAEVTRWAWRQIWAAQ